MGRMVPELRRENIRDLLFGNYRVIYRVDQNRLVVLTVRHCRQLLDVDEVMEAFPNLDKDQI